MIRREDCVKVGYVSKSHNLQGEVVVVSDSDLLEKYVEEPVFILLDGAPVPFFIEDERISVRNHNSYIVKFLFVDTLEQAERLAGSDVLMDKALEEETEDAEDNIYKMIGFSVIDESNPGQRGEVIDVADYSGNVVLTISIFEKEVLLPLAGVFILKSDFKKRELHTRIPEDLFGLY